MAKRDPESQIESTGCLLTKGRQQKQAHTGGWTEVSKLDLESKVLTLTASDQSLTHSNTT